MCVVVLALPHLTPQPAVMHAIVTCMSTFNNVFDGISSAYLCLVQMLLLGCPLTG